MIERITKNEEKLDKILLSVKKLEEALEEFKNNQKIFEELNEYYGSEDWFKDKEAYEKGEISDIKSGVLSEDAIWNLNEDIKDLQIEMNKLREQKYKVITLCGSTRFKDEFLKAQKELTLKGNIVISVGLFGHSGDNEVWENMSEGELTKTKEMLDDIHKRKIDMSDEIFIINVGGYIGESTKSEIEYAKNHGKIVKYLEENI